jgi:WD40 repeat protein
MKRRLAIPEQLFARTMICWVCFIGFFALSSLPVSAQFQQSREKPVLRIETGTHLGKIDRIATDAANRYVATSSEDKTVRVWELATGRLLAVIRPPVGSFEEGQLYAVAMSPDGKTISAAGRTGVQGATSSIYVLSRESGKLVKRLAGLTDAVLQLAYSQDGRFLVATLKRSGIRIYDTVNYMVLAEDTDYGDLTQAADFSSSNRLVTASYDGFIRLYGVGGSPPLHLLMRKRTTGGRVIMIFAGFKSR